MRLDTFEWIRTSPNRFDNFWKHSKTLENVRKCPRMFERTRKLLSRVRVRPNVLKQVAAKKGPLGVRGTTFGQTRGRRRFLTSALFPGGAPAPPGKRLRRYAYGPDRTNRCPKLTSKGHTDLRSCVSEAKFVKESDFDVKSWGPARAEPYRRPAGPQPWQD